MIDLKSIFVAYKDKKVLNNLSLSAQKGGAPCTGTRTR